MFICIPTRGRASSQTTYDELPDNLWPTSMVVCPADEIHFHLHHKRRVQVCHEQGISKVRQFIVDQCPMKKVLMIDDDHIFLRRKAVGDWHLRRLNPGEFNELYTLVHDLLDTYPMVGVSARQGNNRLSGEIEYNMRTCNMYGVRTDILRDERIRFDAVPLMEDFHVTLSLLERGYDVPMVTEFAWDQKASNAAGGCSLYRNGELQTQAAQTLARLHSPWVKVVQKETKAAWVGMQSRTDVQVQWKKARAAGGLKRAA